jgi:1-phosphofructokinase
MIYTYTLNPSIDHYIYLNSGISQNTTNRAYKEYCISGGKGINVSLACKALGLETVCAGICGGFTGAELLRQLDDEGIKTKFVITDKNTRINTKAVYNGSVTEINSPGADISGEALDKLLSDISGMNENDTAVISGSLPYDETVINKVFEAVKNSGAKMIVDTSGKALQLCLSYKPYLIKPNISELSQLFKTEIGIDDVPYYANKLVSDGINNVIVSCGERGAFFADESGCRYLPVNDVDMKAKNTTGAGDSMISGFLFGEQNGLDKFICAVSAGSASAYCEKTLDKNIFEFVYNSYV